MAKIATKYLITFDFFDDYIIKPPCRRVLESTAGVNFRQMPIGEFLRENNPGRRKDESEVARTGRTNERGRKQMVKCVQENCRSVCQDSQEIATSGC